MSLPAGFKPLLAVNAILDEIVFPVIGSPKMDGIRAHSTDDPAYPLVSRELLTIPNARIQQVFKGVEPDLDGELLTLTGGRIDDFNTAQSKIMGEHGAFDVRFCVFDWFGIPGAQYTSRLEILRSHVSRMRSLNIPVRFVPVQILNSMEELMAYEKHAVEVERWEGIMIRRPDGPYKFGRSTMKQGILLKVKRFDDDEGEIVGYKEKMHNANELGTDAFGYAKRSSHAENKIATGVLGAWSIKWKGVTFSCGTGMSDDQRLDYWVRRESFLGKRVKFKYQGVGPNGKPRFPSFLAVLQDPTP